MGIEVQEAVQSDRDELITVYAEAWKASITPSRMALFGDHVHAIDFSGRWPQELNSDTHRCYKAVAGGRIVGCGMVGIRTDPERANERDQGRYGYYKLFYVLPDFKHRGAGADMLLKGTYWLRKQGIGRADGGVIIGEPKQARWIEFLMRHGARMDCSQVDTSSYAIDGKKAVLPLVGVSIPDLDVFYEILTLQKSPLPTDRKAIDLWLQGGEDKQGWTKLEAVLRHVKSGERLF